MSCPPGDQWLPPPLEFDRKEAGEKMPTTVAMIDKLAKKGIIHKNTAAHLKSKLAKRINKLAK